MFLSLVIAPKHQYRALTGLPDERRFNVAMSRARDQVWLFHSVKLEDLSSQDLRSKLLRFFQIPHLMVQSAVHEELSRLNDALRNSRRELGEQPEPYESWFEVDVAVELLRKNYRVIPQFEVAGYRIDLVVEGQQNRLAIECDGEQWHGADRFDYDVARQRQLERAGWQFVRVRESEFYADRNRTINRIVHECNRLDILPVGGINQ
jgi:very-short-patch-repair endonuclease